MDTVAPPGTGLDRTRLTELLRRERAAFATGHPRSGGRLRAGRNPLRPSADDLDEQGIRRVPAVPGLGPRHPGHRHRRPLPHGLFARRHRCHGRAFTAAGTAGRAGGARADLGSLAVMLLPTEEAAEAGDELARRFGAARWSFALTATDANRWAIRLARVADRAREDPVLQSLLPRFGCTPR